MPVLLHLLKSDVGRQGEKSRCSSLSVLGTKTEKVSTYLGLFAKAGFCPATLELRDRLNVFVLQYSVQFIILTIFLN